MLVAIDSYGGMQCIASGKYLNRQLNLTCVDSFLME